MNEEKPPEQELDPDLKAALEAPKPSYDKLNLAKAVENTKDVKVFPVKRNKFSKAGPLSEEFTKGYFLLHRPGNQIQLPKSKTEYVVGPHGEWRKKVKT